MKTVNLTKKVSFFQPRSSRKGADGKVINALITLSNQSNEPVEFARLQKRVSKTVTIKNLRRALRNLKRSHLIAIKLNIRDEQMAPKHP